MQGQRLSRIAGYALSRREAYLVVGLVFGAALAAIIGGWPEWVIPVAIGAGLLLMVLLIVDSILDPGTQLELSLANLDPSKIRDAAYRARVLRAVEYVRAAHKLSRRGAGGSLDAAGGELPQLEQAARSIYEMSLRLEEFRADRLVPRDLNDLQQLKKRQGQLSPDQEEQLEALRQLDGLVRSAEQGIDSALADLGRSYAEMQTIKVTPELRGRAADALEQLDASTKRLSELAAGYDEAYGARVGRGARG